MKELRFIFAVLLAPLVFQGAIADDAVDTARAATRRGTATTVVSGRQKTNLDTKTTPATTATRSTNITKTGAVRERGTETTNGPRDGNVVSNTSRTTTATESKSVSARTTSTIHPRAVTTPKTTSQNASRSAVGVPTRTTGQSRTTIGGTSVNKTRATTALRARSGRGATTARAADTDTTDNLREQILTRNYSKCRTVFNECMDEFCANKDAQLGRCACSARVNEFNSTKKSLSNVEDKLLDFSQRLLTVNLDKEDALAINQATEGELAYTTKDTSESKKMLDEISKKLNTSFNNSIFDQNLNAISLSLNIDSAFDSIDSLAGASTTTKTGTALYTAALPVCREMALEICTQDELNIAESGYQMIIEQDCNTVKKSYQTQADQAREQIRESSALLDMSRLDVYQQRNSDDILTCKSKMLDMLTDSTVCGTNLSKCLDISGRYIDPSTGEAFLTLNLADLATLITRPTGEQNWSDVPGNERFVSYLNSKKTYLEPAMDHCQDIADYVWDEFIDDALAQIKLAQDAKLEDVRQSCTTLTTQCLDSTIDSITDFDARALSIFGVAADKTVNAMCSDVQTACTALMETTGGGATDWQTGMTNIATDKTYDTIMQTCREIGRSCIIQACKSISGNFGLCEDIDLSVNRKAIINGTSCWKEVLTCVASAGSTSLANIQSQHPLTKYTDETDDTKIYAFYDTMYDINDITNIIYSNDSITTQSQCSGQTESNQKTNCVYDKCITECTNSESSQNGTVSEKCYTCRLAEKIWGNCEVAPVFILTTSNSHNMIKIPKDDDTGTLLAWFAKNTGTMDATDSCRDTTCGPGFTFDINSQSCHPSEDFDDSGKYCETGNYFTVNENNLKNVCCNSNVKDSNGNCCQPYEAADKSLPAITIPTDYFGTPKIQKGQKICTNNGTSPVFVARYKDYDIFCLGKISSSDITETEGFPNGQQIKCNGKYVLIEANTNNWNYLNIENILTKTEGSENSNNVYMWYQSSSSEPVCTYTCSDNVCDWYSCGGSGTQCDEPTVKKFISYDDMCVFTRS